MQISQLWYLIGKGNRAVNMAQNKKTIIIAIVIIMAIFLIQGMEKKETLSSSSSETTCGISYNIRVNEGYLCNIECFQMTQTIADCLNSYGYDYPLDRIEYFFSVYDEIMYCSDYFAANTNSDAIYSFYQCRDLIPEVQSALSGTVICSDSSECGINGFTGTEYCFEGNVGGEYINYYCYLPGTTDSYCGDDIETRFIQDCGTNGCTDGACEDGLVVFICNTKADDNCNNCIQDDEFPDAVANWKNVISGFEDSIFPTMVSKWKTQENC